MNSWTGKLIGAIVGLFIAGPYGLLAGLVLGHCFDIGLFDKLLANIGIHRRPRVQSNVQETFFNSTFMIMGYVAKSDGRVSENEIRVARQVMADMGLNADMVREAIRLFEAGKQPDFDLNITVHRLRQACLFHPSLLRTFLEIQIQIAQADGELSAAKRAALGAICRQLGVMGFRFDQFENQYRAGQNYQRYSQQPRPNRQQHLQDAYTILGVTRNTSDVDLKKAYRRLMSQHHPDKLIAKGVPKEMIKIATQKTQQIKSAYETIKQARGL